MMFDGFDDYMDMMEMVEMVDEMMDMSMDETTCTFSETMMSFIFNSGFNYDHNQVCTKTYSCEDSSERLHFKFNRFSLEQGYDFLAIGLPEDQSIDDGYSSLVSLNLPNVLILDGDQETDIWVNAESIENFRVSFYRKGLKRHSK